MEKNISAISSEANSRRKLITGIGLLSLLAPLASAAKIPFIKKNIKTPMKPSSNKVKMLTQDGKLVEVDENFLSAIRQKATNDDLKSWIKK
ncbi:MAG: hypothetical protein ACR2IM_10485 [Sediminibacterium sp.]